MAYTTKIPRKSHEIPANPIHSLFVDGSIPISWRILKRRAWPTTPQWCPPPPVTSPTAWEKALFGRLRTVWGQGMAWWEGFSLRGKSV